MNLEHQAGDAVLEKNDVEVDQESGLLLTETKVSAVELRGEGSTLRHS